MSKLVRFCACLALGLAAVACGDNNPSGNKDPDPMCGDGRVDPGEVCDDGNATDGDGCDTSCTATACGNGIVTMDEGCDDGNDVDGDGCDSNCMVTGCGNGVVSDGEACDDGNTVNGDGCDNNCQATGCGNGVMSEGEICDDGNTVDGDGCDSNCTVSGCGNGVVSDGEECDDGNTVIGDGCSATCESEILEIEPNEDGSISTGGTGTLGNDFASAAADTNGAFEGSTTLYGALTPAGDEDVFAFTNSGAAPMIVRFDVWSMAAGYGVGVSCGDSIDTALNIRNAAGDRLTYNDDRSDDDACSGLEFPLYPGQTVYAHVVEYGDNSAIDGYALVAAYSAPVCGDMNIGPGEQCDDGNADAGDGCSDTCQIEGAVAEMEPNEDGTPSTGGSGTTGNDFASANADANGAYSASTLVVASISPAGDEDVFAFTNTDATPVTARFDTWNLAQGYGVGVSCGSSIDTALNLRDAGGALLASSGDRSFSPSDWCSGLTRVIAPGETVYAHVVEHGDNDQIVSYALQVVYTPTICGDGTVGPGEQCDDSNTMSGDGCSATCQTEVICGDGVLGAGEQCDDNNTTIGDGCSDTCQLEGSVAETEPNEDGTPSTGGSTTNGNDFASANADAIGAFTDSVIITAAVSPVGDEDVFAFSNPNTTYVTLDLDVWNLAPGYGIGTPCGSSIDTGMRIRDASGTSLAENDDRNGSSDRCSTLSFDLAPGATVYAHVLDYADDAAIPAYALVAAYTPVVCGDGNVEAGEECDDGNTTPDDGCSATCMIEVICGDGVLNTGEQCDDSNTTAGDGCSDTCQLEGAVTEVEPNDDGTIATGASGITGNDFSSTNANGPFSSDTLIAGALSPAGDEDVYAFTNPGAGYMMVRFDTWNLAPGYGVGTPCGSSIDIGLHIRDAAGTSLRSNDDRNGTSDQCAGLEYAVAPGATVYAHVVERGDNAAVASYALEVTYAPVVCGDGEVEPGEQCDDGGTTDGDGCSATCLLEGVAELEPNDDGTINTGASGITGNDFDAAAAQGPFSADTLIVGSLGPAGDEDVFAFTNPGAMHVVVRFDTWNIANGFTVGDACGSSIDTGLHIRDASGASLQSNNDRNGSSDRCAGTTYVIAPGATVYAHVVENGDNAEIEEYALEVTYLATSVVAESEPNDDGMVSTGATGITGNDFSSANANGPFSASTLIVASLSPAGDEDVYAISNPGAEDVSVRFDFWRLGSTHGVGIACGTSIDTGLHIRDASGSSLAENDDRNSSTDWCAGLAYTIPAGETVYAHVIERGDNAEIPSYALEIKFPTP